jgi:drug/metabolite transporter (DMT)-like permease
MTVGRALFVAAIAAVLLLALARRRRDLVWLVAAVAAGLVLTSYAAVFAAGDIDCEETASCGPVTGVAKWVFGLALVTVVVATIAALVRGGLRPRPFRTTSGRSPLPRRPSHRDAARRRPAAAF